MSYNFIVNRIFLGSWKSYSFGKKNITGLRSSGLAAFTSVCSTAITRCTVLPWFKNVAHSAVVGPQCVALFSFRLNILVLGGSSGFIELYAYGMFKIARVTGVSSSLKFSVSIRK